MRIRRLLVLLILFACGGDPWRVKDAPNVPPDEQFRTGVEAGEDVYVWHCHQGSRIVVSQFGSACFGTRSPVLERGPCGAPLEHEAQIKPEWRKEIPPAQRWPGSPDASTSN